VADGNLDFVGKREGWTVLATDFEADPDVQLNLDLLFGWSPEGRVQWSDVRITELSAAPPSRMVTLAAVNGNPKEPKSPADCVRFYCERVEAAASQGADLVVLPEFMNVVGLQDQAEFAEPIPGPTSDYLAEAAREKGIHVAAGILERRDKALMGITPGDTYPVFNVDFGTLGYMICYDAHFPEVARCLSLNGAEVIAFSNMGDGREKGAMWEPYIRTRAMDSQVHIVASVNSGRSCIVSPKGEILAMASKEPGEIAIAECDLTSTITNYTGQPIRRRYDQVRRADTFRGLSHHLYDE